MRKVGPIYVIKNILLYRRKEIEEWPDRARVTVVLPGLFIHLQNEREWDRRQGVLFHLVYFSNRFLNHYRQNAPPSGHNVGTEARISIQERKRARVGGRRRNKQDASIFTRMLFQQFDVFQQLLQVTGLVLINNDVAQTEFPN
jgi:hypothetical protein